MVGTTKNDTPVCNTKLSQTTDATGAARFGLPSFEDHTFLIFGYGSILWKQNFEFVESYPCYVKGYTRVFYQGTQEHRGTPGNPGRVVTLLPSANPEERVYGKAYQLPSDPQQLEEILAALDVREQEGYDRVSLDLFEAQAEEKSLTIHHDAEKKVVTLVYMAVEGNSDYLGEDTVEEMAAHILRCEGPSGTNREYLFRLADCLRELGAVDEHVFAIDAEAKRQLAEAETISTLEEETAQDNSSFDEGSLGDAPSTWTSPTLKPTANPVFAVSAPTTL
ncbi:cation transport protein ChaC [Angomonas deanei]|uniref:glutathione-specific gamma-glutamylcyclotransferase n=1 Tax=Angomonas deanei TaxID=59799 RepID=S9VEF4_9TRYP|nr:cation transport protein ChaC [Angomonas deanei]EPY30684.1 cation transport protein ChaC [Angomonas deanei]CAD2218444.1 ChaC-like protein, putative [Angomonas deanei]|eukprot:EPY25481.1 cation transport protein ChaC [Angomonas deanei]